MLALAVLIVLVVAILSPRDRGPAAQVLVVVAGALAIRLLVRSVRLATWAPGPFAFDQALVLRPARPPALPSEPERIRFEVGAATHRAMELNHQFRRRLRGLAQDRLTAAHGVDLDADPEAARKLLGEEAWDLLRPDREPPADRFGPGMPIDEVTRIVDAVEGLAR